METLFDNALLVVRQWWVLLLGVGVVICCLFLLYTSDGSDYDKGPPPTTATLPIIQEP